MGDEMTTEAGRALLEKVWPTGLYDDVRPEYEGDVAAIEAEARQQGYREAREAVAAQHIYDTLAAHEAALAAIDALMGGSPK